MLILSRKIGEEIVIGENDIVVRVVYIGHDRVKLGVHAPSDITVHRREVYEEIKREHDGDRHI